MSNAECRMSEYRGFSHFAISFVIFAITEENVRFEKANRTFSSIMVKIVRSLAKCEKPLYKFDVIGKPEPKSPFSGRVDRCILLLLWILYFCVLVLSFDARGRKLSWDPNEPLFIFFSETIQLQLAGDT